VLSIDGSTLQLPKHESIEEEFGTHGFGPKADSPKNLARISYLYDVLNGLVLDAQMKSYITSEADLAWEHIDCLASNDIVIFDRYYPSIPFMFALKSMGVDFCFRMKSDWWKKVRDFSQGKSNDKTVVFELPKRYLKWAEENNMPKRIVCRLVKKRNKEGETAVFCTSLLSKKKYSKSSIFNLYKKRWNVEEGYKLIKSRLEVEDFSGVKSIVVKQDFYAKTLLLTINAIMCQKIRPSRKRAGNRELNMNKTIGLSAAKKVFVKIALKWECKAAIDYYTNLLKGKFNYSRKGQSTPRKKKCHDKFNMNYKTALT
jgi:hypothetical protein